MPNLQRHYDLEHTPSFSRPFGYQPGNLARRPDVRRRTAVPLWRRRGPEWPGTTD